MHRERVKLCPVDGENGVIGDLLNSDLVLHSEHAEPALCAGDSRLGDANLFGQGGVFDPLLGLPTLELLKQHGHRLCRFGIFSSSPIGNSQHFHNAETAMASCRNAREAQP